MARPRAFDERNVVAAAKGLFWDKGYLSTSLDDVQEATRLSRSSLYLAFESKGDLFAAALRLYHQTFIDPLLGPLEDEGASLREIVGYFKIIATLFNDPEAQRGCLMVNTIGECGGRDPGLTQEGEQFLNRVRSAFTNALRSSVRARVMTRRQATERAALLTGVVVGAWMTVRADPSAARALCLATAAQVESWGGT